MFAGSQQLTIDDKGRLAVPARIRQQLTDDYGLEVFVTRAYEPCLEIYPAAVFHDIAQQIQDHPDRRAADRLTQIFIGSAVEATIDRQGRILVPSLLRKFAQLQASVVLVGQIRRLDLWSEDLWNERFGEGAGSREELSEIFSLLKR